MTGAHDRGAHAIDPLRRWASSGDARGGRSAGRPLDPTTRTTMESRFGHDFGAVRVHADNHADEAARGLGARAITVGSDVAFTRGSYAPGTARGRRLLAHELTHVVQQAGRPPSGTTPDRSGESVAHAASSLVAAGGRADVSPAAVNGPQLQDHDEVEVTGESPGEVITEGLKITAGQLFDLPAFRLRILDPLGDEVLHRVEGLWHGMPVHEQAVLVGAGATGVLALAGVAGTSPEVLALLDGVDIGTPLGWIPYSPLEGFSVSRPTGDGPETRRWTFTTDFSLDPVSRLIEDRLHWEGFEVGARFLWTFDPVTDQIGVTHAMATLGIAPGLELAGGFHPGLMGGPELLFGPGQEAVWSGAALPRTGPDPAPDLRFSVNVDLLRLMPALRANF